MLYIHQKKIYYGIEILLKILIKKVIDLNKVDNIENIRNRKFVMIIILNVSIKYNSYSSNETHLYKYFEEIMKDILNDDWAKIKWLYIGYPNNKYIIEYKKKCIKN